MTAPACALGAAPSVTAPDCAPGAAPSVTAPACALGAAPGPAAVLHCCAVRVKLFPLLPVFGFYALFA